MSVSMSEICGKRTAKYVCQECGRKVCEFCLVSHIWLCVYCYNRLKREALTFETSPWLTPFKMLLLAFLIIFVGVILLVVAAMFSEGAFSGGVVWFFPFPPLIIGSVPCDIWVVLLGAAIVAFCIAWLVLWWKQVK